MSNGRPRLEEYPVRLEPNRTLVLGVKTGSRNDDVATSAELSLSFVVKTSDGTTQQMTAPPQVVLIEMVNGEAVGEKLFPEILHHPPNPKLTKIKVPPGRYLIVVHNDPSFQPLASSVGTDHPTATEDIQSFRLLRIRENATGANAIHLFDLDRYNSDKGGEFTRRFQSLWRHPTTNTDFDQNVVGNETPALLPPLTTQRDPRPLLPKTLTYVQGVLFHARTTRTISRTPRGSHQCLYLSAGVSASTGEEAARNGFAWTTYNGVRKVDIEGCEIAVTAGYWNLEITLEDLSTTLGASGTAFRCDKASLSQDLVIRRATWAVPTADWLDQATSSAPPGGVRWLYCDNLDEFIVGGYAEERVLGVGVPGNPVFQLELELSNDGPLRPEQVNIELFLVNKERRERVVLEREPEWRQRGDRVRLGFRVDDVLAAIREINRQSDQVFLINGSFLEALAQLKSSESWFVTRELVYLLKQHPLFFLPGVFGSEIEVRHDGGTEEAWPEFSRIFFPGGKEIHLLACSPDGSPRWQAVRTTLLDYVFVPRLGSVYRVLDLVTSLSNRWPGVYLDRAKTLRVKQVAFAPVPYDWRLDISSSYLQIARDIDRTYEELAARSEIPFLDNRISIVGHSTGGVVLRGLASLPNALRDRIGSAFFVNTPFWGAPKAEYVLLTGDMGSEFEVLVNDADLAQLAPDLPVLYHLSPGEEYGGEWSVANREARFVAAKREAGGCSTRQRIELYRWPEFRELTGGMLTFNRALAERARKFRVRCRSARADQVDAYVFHSSGLRTITGTSHCVDGEVRAAETQHGDGTVPSRSQVAEGDISRWATIMRPTQDEREHTKAANSEWVWGKIQEILDGVSVGVNLPDTDIQSRPREE